MSKVSPCMGCDERERGCHDHCIAYKKWKTEYQNVRKNLDDTISGINIQINQYQYIGRTKKFGGMLRNGEVDFDQ